MPVANIFNVTGTGSTASLPILTGDPGYSWRVRQLNVQNRDASTTANISITDDVGNVIIGPISITAGQLLSLELASEEYQHMLILPSGVGLNVVKDSPVSLTVFGFAGLA